MSHLALLEQRGVVQHRNAVQEIAHRHLHFVLQDQLFQFARAADQQRQPHRFVALPEAGDGACDQPVLFQRGVADQAQRQAADQLAMHVAGLGGEVVQRGQRAARQPGETLALGRQPEAAPAALAQAEVQPRLQRGELAADGGLAHAQHVLRGRYAAGVDDGQEHPDQPEIQIGNGGQHRVITYETLIFIDAC